MKTTIKRANELQYAGQTANASQNRELTTEHDCPECGEHFSTCICEEAQGKPESAYAKATADKLPEHSPLPWEIGDSVENPRGMSPFTAINDGRYGTAYAFGEERSQRLANAKLIVASVNHADKLAEALRESLACLTADSDSEEQYAGEIQQSRQALANWEKAKQ